MSGGDQSYQFKRNRAHYCVLYEIGIRVALCLKLVQTFSERSLRMYRLVMLTHHRRRVVLKIKTPMGVKMQESR
jgi:hypothetical protein